MRSNCFALFDCISSHLILFQHLNITKGSEKSIGTDLNLVSTSLNLLNVNFKASTYLN